MYNPKLAVQAHVSIYYSIVYWWYGCKSEKMPHIIIVMNSKPSL